jgi:hypothetical protein
MTGASRTARVEIIEYNVHVIDSALVSQVAHLSPAERLELIAAVWETLGVE